MARSLAERLRAHEQQKARLAEQEAKLKADERKARTRQLIQAGGLVDKAGLLELEPNALYGALLSLRDGAADPEQVRQWAAFGGRAFAREARLAEEGKEAIVLAFPAALGRDATTALRGAGFRFNKLLQHWEGLARFDEAEALPRHTAARYGGSPTVGPLPRVGSRSLLRIAPQSDLRTPGHARATFDHGTQETRIMRSLALLFCALLLGATAAARADSLADLRLPSSTVPGCVNDWGPLGTGSGIAEPTCEGKAALAEWNEHAAAINAARDTLARAANSPDKAAPLAVIDALDACAAAADTMARLYRPAPSAPHDDAAVLAWMRTWLEQSKLPIPVTIGDGFRALAAALARPGLRRQERNTLYGLAAMFATRESALAAERGAEVERQTDNAVRAAHLDALKAAANAEAGHPQRAAGAAIAAAAGPDHLAIAQRQTAQLAHSLARPPGPPASPPSPTPCSQSSVCP